jgi:hypothetical protein
VKYVLIILIYSGTYSHQSGKTSVVAEFESKTACEKARNWANGFRTAESYQTGNTYAECFEKK